MMELAWIGLGLVIGLVTTRIFGQRGRDRLTAIVLGTLAAYAGGWSFTTFAEPNAPNLDVSGLVIAANAAVLVLMIYRAVTMRPEQS